MKKLLTLSMVILMSTAGFSQFADGAVKLNLFGLAVGQFQVGYEHALNENSSVQLSAGFISRTWDTGVDGFGAEQKNTGFVIIPEYRIYVTEGLKGVYGGAFARYRSVSIDYTFTGTGGDSTTEYSRTAVGGGLLLGYQFIVADKVLLDLFAGPQYKSASTKVESGTDGGFELEGEGDGIGLRFGFNVGVLL